jgi:iron complex transport system permease protein
VTTTSSRTSASRRLPPTPGGPDATGPVRTTTHRPAKITFLFAGLTVALVAIGLTSAALGQYSIGFGAVASSVAHRLTLPFGPLRFGRAVPDPFGEATLWQIRLPRLVLSFLVGAVLACSGALLQGAFGNPLADPGVIGVSTGAAVGAAVVIVAGVTVFGSFTVPIAAFVTGLAATLLVYALSRSNGRTEVVTLVLTGIAVNAVTGAGLAGCLFFGTQTARDQIVFWQLGSLNGSRWVYVGAILPFVAVGLIGAFAVSKQLDLLALGDRSARHLGVHVERLRLVVIVFAATMVAAAVAFAGVIGFVGLVVPHLIRMLIGPGHRVLVPASILGGALLLAAADLVARTAVDYADLPIGMLTALVGGPFFFWMLRRTRAQAGGWA